MKKTIQKQKTKSRISDLEYRLEELKNNELIGQSVGMEAIALFALKTNVVIAIDDGAIKEADMERARVLLMQIGIRINNIKNNHKEMQS
jgi:hypothetical protein